MSKLLLPLNLVLSCSAILALIPICSPCSWGQSLNVDFGVGAGPPDSYAAAGEAGRWNSLLGTQGTTYSMLGLQGQNTTATVLNIGGSQLQQFDHAETTGGDDTLLDDYLVTFTPTLETCLFFNGLQNGTYRVITYAWLPNLDRESWVTVDQANAGGTLVGGVWQGALAEGVVYSVHTAEVVQGSLGVHSGIPTGGSPQIAALNGIQLLLLPEAPLFRRGDVVPDGELALNDVIAQLSIMFLGAPAIPCEDVLDANDNGSVGIEDVISVLNFLFNNGAEPAVPFAACGEDPTADALSCRLDPCVNSLP